jgi:hypothetical protein
MMTLKIILRFIGMLLLLVGFAFVVERYPHPLWFFGTGWICVLISFFIKTPQGK